MAQHDYVIANGTGAAVRSDLNNALAAIVSNNSGATTPATTYAYQWWADTTTNTLKLRNSANSAWIELRQLDGDFTTVSVDNGTAAAPSIYFNASGTDTGIFSSGTDAVDISTAGARRFGISSSGELTAYGGNLTLNAQGDLRFSDSDSSNWVAFQSPATVSSNVTWTLPSADGTANQALTTNGSGTLSWATPSSANDKITEGNTEAEVVDTGSDGHFKVTTEGSERMRITSEGSLLVNATSVAGVATARSYIYSSVGANSNVSTYANQNTTLHARFEATTNNEGASSALVLQLNNMAGANKPQLLRGYNSSDGFVLNADYRGALTNFGNSYGAISDIRVKQDIVDATSAWADIKQVKVRKYRIKNEVVASGDNADVYLGVVAQELEQVSPGLVTTPADYESDPDATKSVKYSVLYMKAVKALQEAMERIETLEAKVAALESA